jgi:hypothetical protein
MRDERVAEPSGLTVVLEPRAAAPLDVRTAAPLADVTEPSALRVAPRARTVAPCVPLAAVTEPLLPTTLALFGRASAVLETTTKAKVDAINAIFFVLNMSVFLCFVGAAQLLARCDQTDRRMLHPCVGKQESYDKMFQA